MNEMNNGENNFNNQNIGQPNLNENQNMVQPEQQYVQPEQPVSEPSKKINALVIILLLLVIGLAGFIFYDKVIKKEEPKEPEKQEEVIQKDNLLVKYDKNQITKKENVTENGITYYEVFTIKNSDLIVDIKLFTEKDQDGQEYDDGYYDKVVMHLYINGVKKDEVVLEKYFRCNVLDCEVKDQYHFDDIKSKWEEKILNVVGTIKGDKNYLYIALESENSSIYIINEKGIILDTAALKFYGQVTISNKCSTYKYGKVNENNEVIGKYFIEEDAIYYLSEPEYSNVEKTEMSDEYKVTISNNELVKEKIDSCRTTIFGQK